MEKLPECNQITYQETKLPIRKLKNDKAPGPDNIPNEALKNMDRINCEQTTRILNQILMTEDFPPSWQNSKIIRIYKGKGTNGKWAFFPIFSYIFLLYAAKYIFSSMNPSKMSVCRLFEL